MTSPAALITGASSGIGRELARIHCSRGGNAILVARRKEKLEELKDELETSHSISAYVIEMDLAAENGAIDLFKQIKELGIEVDILINNAGFGGHGLFHERDLAWNLKMVDLNIKALVTLTHLFLQDRIERNKGGKILNVGSTAGMVPGPLQATYHATKAFVNSFSQAIANEVADKNITVTVLAPGAVATEFFETADMTEARGPQESMATPQSVAKIGYDAMMNRELIAVNEWKLKFLLRFILPFLPRRMVLNMARQFGEKE